MPETDTLWIKMSGFLPLLLLAFADRGLGFGK